MTGISQNKSFRMDWLDLMKAFAIFWVFSNHLVEQIFGGAYLANPTDNWPTFQEQLHQLVPLSIEGWWSIPENAYRYFGLLGDQGVQLFIILSGFGLTWGLLKQGSLGPYPLHIFYLKRFERIYPLWWGAHIFFAITWYVSNWGLSLFDKAFYLSFLGDRFTQGMANYFAPAWWFIGLLIQLYLVYPFLWYALRKLGPMRFFIVVSIIAFIVRGIGLYSIGQVGGWSRGAIFITRLPEFAFGISLAAWMFEKPSKVDQFLRSPFLLSLAFLTYIVGNILSMTLFGMTVALFFTGFGAFVILYALLTKADRSLPSSLLLPILWTGKHSYSLYLMHQPWIMHYLNPSQTGTELFFAVCKVILITLISAVFLEWAVSSVTRYLSNQIKKRGAFVGLTRVFIYCLITLSLFIGANYIVQREDPQEVLGWGERPSLEPDPTEVGWHMIPNKTTHLRWRSYDYVVTANALGFPGPLYPVQKAPNTFRILVTGDAFTSAEGVNTDEAWPHLLEKKLSKKMNQNVEVLNFGITGYGPEQYCAVIEKYAPIYHPDLIIVETFVNDFDDVMTSNETFRESIGFEKPPQDGIVSMLYLSQLRAWIHLKIIDPILDTVLRRPNSEGYFFGYFLAFDTSRKEFHKISKSKTRDCFEKIKEVADQIHSSLIVFMAPSSIQVCLPEQLIYYPKYVDFNDPAHFDKDLPQRKMKDIADSLDIKFYDLRDVLKSKGKCYYQPRNMHWTNEGHEVTADYLADIVAESLHNR